MKQKVATTFLVALAISSVAFAGDREVCYFQDFYGDAAADKQKALVDYGRKHGFSQSDLDRAAVPNSKGRDSHRLYVLTSSKADANGTHTLTLADKNCKPLTNTSSKGTISDQKLRQDFIVKDRDTSDGTRGY